MSKINSVALPSGNLKFGVPFDVTIEYVVDKNGSHQIDVYPVAHADVSPSAFPVNPITTEATVTMVLKDQRSPSETRLVRLAFVLGSSEWNVVPTVEAI